MTIDNQNASRFGGDFTDLWITVDETKLHFVKTGEGPPIILIPGWPQIWYAWRRVMPLLAKSGRRVIVCDPPGLGPAGKKYDTRAVADLLANRVT